MPRPRYEELDALRGIAAIVVVFFHAGFFFAEKSPWVGTSFTKNGYLMVDLFFVLSGFVIASSYMNRLSSAGDLFVFQIRRMARLLPLHFITLFAFLGIEAWLYQQSFDLETAAFERNSIDAFLSNLVLLQPFTQDEMTFNFAAWSIAVEFYTYMLFAAVVFLCNGRMHAMHAIFILTVLMTGLYLINQENLDMTQTGGMVRCLFGFSLGVLLYSFGLRLRVSWLWSALALALTVTLLYFRDQLPVHDLVFPVLFVVVICTLVASGDSPIKWVLRRQFLQRHGELSLGIYLWHAVVFWVLPHVIGSLLGAEVWIEPFDHHVFINLAPFGHTLLLVIGLLITYLLAAVSYRFVERPVNEWAKRATTAKVAKDQKLAASIA